MTKHDEYIQDHHKKVLDLIRRWYEEGVVMPLSDPKVINWLECQTSDTWHKFACSWNYDYRTDILNWIVSHPRCDKGTAIEIFRKDASNWMNEPLESLNSCYHDSWKSVKTAENRLQKNDFATSELIPVQNYYPSYFTAPLNSTPQFKIHPEVEHYQGTRQAKSIYCVSEGSIMLDYEPFCESIGVKPL